MVVASAAPERLMVDLVHGVRAVFGQDACQATQLYTLNSCLAPDRQVNVQGA